jgi:formylglycine-generating enzyme required for sulfatase activity
MARIEKTVFISYRRADVYTALAVYENLKNQGYDVFFDYRSISSGDFEQIITGNIRARAHFLIILTPTALDRCNEPGDWLRREIELAIDEKRNIVPLFFRGFRFGALSKSGMSRWLRVGKPEVLTGKLRSLSRYNGLNVHEDYFEEAMNRLRTEYLNKPLDTVLHPVSTEVRKVVKEEQDAADEALEQIEDVKELVKQADEKSVQLTEPDPMPALENPAPVASRKEKQPEIPKEKDADLNPVPKKEKTKSAYPFSLPAKKTSIPSLNYRLFGGIAGGALLLVLIVWSGINVFQNKPSATPNPTRDFQVVATQTSHLLETNTPSPTRISTSASTQISNPVKTNTPSPTKTLIPPTPALGSTILSEKDGMTLLYVPGGEFVMGSNTGAFPAWEDHKPEHSVFLDAFWIDKTEVTNAMYAKCVQDGQCNPPSHISSSTRDRYYGNPEFDNYPVIWVTWNTANKYCEWAGRRLPTEAEWEKSARGESAFIYPWGNEELDSNRLNNSGDDTTEVGKYPLGASPYGALDMAGNVAEWVADWYSETYYQNLISTNPLGPSSGTERVIRGGTYGSGSSFYSAYDRNGIIPGGSAPYYGIRCAMSATP